MIDDQEAPDLHLHSPYEQSFPEFAKAIDAREDSFLEEVLPGATEDEIRKLEADLGLVLPDSYKDLLRCARGFWLFEGAIQLSTIHPFYHDFPPLSALNKTQLDSVKRMGGVWPPPTKGMLCFAEYCVEDEGDQVLWDVTKPANGEYHIYYYAHSAEPPSIRKIADKFEEFISTMLDRIDLSD